MTGKENSVGAAIAGWWIHCISADSGAARKTRALLRRAASPAEVLAIEATHELHGRLAGALGGRDMSRGRSPLRLALIAAVIAGLDPDSEGRKERLAERLGGREPEGRSLKALRFQRIIHSDDDWTLATRLRRALPLAGRKANIGRLGSDLFYWGDRVRANWCFDYFGASRPGDNEPESADTLKTGDA